MNKNDTFEAVVIGAGFGGTIISLALSNKFENDNKENGTDKKVCILERGKWWIEPGMKYAPQERRNINHNLREYLEDNRKPYGFFTQQDNIKGALEVLSTARGLSKIGLYDVRFLGNVSVICASGVGGGSLIYSNVIQIPHSTVYKDWPTQFDGKKLEDYFDIVKAFIGVNKVIASGLNENNPGKNKVFKEAGQELINDGEKITNIKNDNGMTVGDFDLDLSITVGENISDGESSIEGINKSNRNNACKRHGRCIFGCIHGARHTLDNKLIDAMNPKIQTRSKPLECRELSEVFDIEIKEDEQYKYTINYFYYDPETEKRQTKKIYSKILIISAGGIGSCELMMKCKERGHLKLSEMLGKKFFVNGDILGYMKLKDRRIDITKGPLLTAGISFKTEEKEFAYTIEDSTVSKMASPFFATIFELHAGLNENMEKNLKIKLFQNLDLFRRFWVVMLMFRTVPLRKQINLFSRAWNHNVIRIMLRGILKTISTDMTMRRFMGHILTFATTDYADPFALPEDRISKFFVFACMGRGEKPSILKLKPKWKNMENRNDYGEKLFIEWPAKDNNKIFKEITEGMRKIAGKIENEGENKVHTPYWNLEEPQKSTVVTLHPLGGCIMGNDVENGVVNNFGQVFWNDGSSDKKKVYPDLYVVDGSIVPETLGVNPALTIAAIAFRTAEKIVGKDFLPH